MRAGFAGCLTVVTVAFRAAVLLSAAAGAAQAGKSFVLDEGKETVSALDANGTQVMTFATSPSPSGIAITPDCAKLYVGSYYADIVSVFDPARGTLLATIHAGRSPRNLTMTSDGAKLYTANFDSVDVSVIDTARDMVVATIPIGDTPVANLSGPVMTPDGGKAYIVDQPSNFVAVIDTASDRVVTRIQVGDAPARLAMSPDGGKVYVANFFSSSVSVIATASDKVVATIDVGGGPDQLFITRNGKVYARSLDDIFSVIDPAADKVVGTILTTEGARGALSSDGTRLYINGPVICPGMSHSGIIGMACDVYGTIRMFMLRTTEFVSVIDTANDKLIATVPIDDPGRSRAENWSLALQTPENGNCH